MAGKYDLNAVATHRQRDPRDVKIDNLTREVNTLKDEFRKLTSGYVNFVREFNKMKNDMGAMRKKHKSEVNRLESKITTASRY